MTEARRILRDGGSCPGCGEPVEHYLSQGWWCMAPHAAPPGAERKRRAFCRASYCRLEETAR